MPWELYDLSRDFSQSTDVAAEEPERVRDLSMLWFAMAGRYGLFPLHGEQLMGLAPRANRDLAELTLWPFAAAVPNDSTVSLIQRAFNVIAPVELAAGDEGVIVAQGDRFAGWTLFVQGGRLVYEQNYLGLEHFRVASTEPLPTGKVELGMALELQGELEISPTLSSYGMRGKAGFVRLYADGAEIGAGAIPKLAPFSWSLSGEGIAAGWDSESAVSDRYTEPFRFTGKLDRVVISVSGEPFEDFAKTVEKAWLVQ